MIKDLTLSPETTSALKAFEQSRKAKAKLSKRIPKKNLEEIQRLTSMTLEDAVQVSKQITRARAEQKLAKWRINNQAKYHKNIARKIASKTHQLQDAIFYNDIPYAKAVISTMNFKELTAVDSFGSTPLSAAIGRKRATIVALLKARFNELVGGRVYA